MATSTVFETEACGRCGGTGTYSYCERWGTTCFDCGTKPGVPGSGRRLTKRGFAARAHYLSLLPTRAARALKVGDRLADRGGLGKLTVTEIRPATGWSKWTVGGVEHRLDASTGAVDVVTDKDLYGCVPPDRMFDLLPTVAEGDAARAAALAFEATLT